MLFFLNKKYKSIGVTKINYFPTPLGNLLKIYIVDCINNS